MESGVTRAAANKKIRQEALRDQLASQKHVEKVVDNIEKIEDLDNDLEFNDIQRIKVANEHRLKLISKYCPDLKAVELTGDVDVRTVVIRKDLTGNAND